MLDNLIMDFQSSLLEQEIAWNNIENVFLIERVSDILSVPTLLEEPERIGDDRFVNPKGFSVSAGSKKDSIVNSIKETAKKIVQWFSKMIDNLKSHFGNMFNAIKKKIDGLKGKSYSSEGEVVIDVPNFEEIGKALAKFEQGTTDISENVTVPTKKVKSKNGLKGIIDSIIQGIVNLFNRAKGLFSKSNSECSKGTNEAKKAESSGDQQSLSKAQETKKKVSIFAKGLAFVFKCISKAFSAIANSHAKKAGKELDKSSNSYENAKRKEKEGKGSLGSQFMSGYHLGRAMDHGMKAKENKAKADKYAAKAAKLRKEDAEIDALLEELLMEEEVLDEKCGKKAKDEACCKKHEKDCNCKKGSPEADEVEDDSEALDEELDEFFLDFE